MNDRIRELAITSQLVYGTDDGQLLTGWMDHVDLTEYLEEYAKLIVQECADIANAGIDPAESHLIGDDILKHFGINNALDNVRAGAEQMAGDGGYNESTKEKHEAAVKQRSGDKE